MQGDTDPDRTCGHKRRYITRADARAAKRVLKRKSREQFDAYKGSTPMQRLTPRTRRVWCVISAYPRPLSIREIARCTGMRSSSTVNRHMRRLAALGIIERTKGQRRAYNVVERYSWVACD